MEIPKYQLQKVCKDGSREEPALYEIHDLPRLGDFKLGRRGFLLTSAIGAGLMGALSTGCADLDLGSGWPFGMDSSEGLEKTPLRAHLGVVAGLAFSPDGSLLASHGRGSIEVRELPSGNLRAAFGGTRKSRGSSALCFSPDGRWLMAADESVIALFSAPFTALSDKLEGHAGHVTSLAMNPGGDLLVSGSTAGEILIWEFSSRDRAPTLRTRLVDLAATPKNVKARQYTVEGATYVAPCGTPLPPGAVCTCNCVPGSYAPPAPVSAPAPAPTGRVPSYGGTVCTCNKICTCVPIK